MLAQSENPQYTKATSNKLSDTFTSSLEIQNQNSTERDCVTSQTGNYELLTKQKMLEHLAKKTQIFTQKMKNLAWITQILRKIYANYAKFTQITQIYAKNFCDRKPKFWVVNPSSNYWDTDLTRQELVAQFTASCGRAVIYWQVAPSLRKWPLSTERSF